MPFIRFTAFKYYTLLAISISLNREIISPYSHYIKKGLVYITLIIPFSHQPFSYLEYTKANTYFSYYQGYYYSHFRKPLGQPSDTP
jgi:hypothetical protein